MPWKIKLGEDEKPVFAEVKEGELPKLVFINSEGKELALDGPGMYDKIIEMGKTEKDLRAQVKRMGGTLELFSGIEDLADWKANADKALETVENFNDKDWMEAKKVEKLKEDMKLAHEKQINQMSESFNLKEKDHLDIVTRKDAQIRKLMVSNKFATHPLFAGAKPKTNLPPEIAETYFGKHFTVEDGENGELILVAKYGNGDQVYSEEKPGEPAEFFEAMNIIFEKYPGKEHLIRAGKPGSGSKDGDDSDDTDRNVLQELQSKYDAAQKAGDTPLMITLKRQITEEKNKRKAA